MQRNFNKSMVFSIVFRTLLVMLFLISSAYQPPKEKRLRKVVIDAGHGGKDPGTVGKKVKEKEVALGVALKLGRYINENYKDVEVIYTRSTDVFIELYRRAQIANENHADLFISIHCNGTKSPQAKGTETWVMGLHKSAQNLEVARTENAAILKEDNYNQYDGFDPQSPEATIIFSLYQNSYLDQSLDLASKVQKQFKERLKLGDRGVKQAGFWVLYKTTMPGILVETGFLSNPDDEKFLATQTGQEQIAYSVFLAFREYKEGIDGVNVPLLSQPPPQYVPHEDSNDTETKTAIRQINKNAGQEGITNVRTEDKPEEKKPDKILNNKPVYRIQIASSDKLLKEGNPVFKGQKNIWHYMHKGVYKFTAGECSSMEEALDLQKKLMSKGFKDAFVVPFLGNDRISLEEAKKLSAN